MQVKVKSPGDCPLRYQDGEFRCAVSRGTFRDCECADEDEFPEFCPLRSRVVVIEKVSE